MLTKRMVQAFVLAALLVAVAVGLPRGAQADPYLWHKTPVAGIIGDHGRYSSIGVDTWGNVFISYYENATHDLWLAVCEIGASANGNCDEAWDWEFSVVDSAGDVGKYTSITLGYENRPSISYYDESNDELKFAQCARWKAGCNMCTGDACWYPGVVDSAGPTGRYSSVEVDNGFYMISYYDEWSATDNLYFAICDTRVDYDCNATASWNKTAVDTVGDVGMYTSIDVYGGDPVISYYDNTNHNLKYATCNLLSDGTGCNETSDWSMIVTVDAAGHDVGEHTSIVAGNDVWISYYDWTNGDLKVATCAGGWCDEASDWQNYIVDWAGDVGEYSSIAEDANGDPVISYYRYDTGNLKLATCDWSATGCDQPTDWSLEAVDTEGIVGMDSSIAVSPSDGRLVISYRYYLSSSILMFATNRPDWGDWQGLGGILNGKLSAAATASNNVYMFGTNAAGKAYFRHWNGTSWEPWSSMGGTFTSPLTAVAAGTDIYVFGLGGGGVPYYKRLSGGSWSGWLKFPGSPGKLAGELSAVAVGDHVYMFGTNAAGKPYFRHWNGTSWDPWSSMGGTLTSPPTAVVAGTDIYVFGLGGGGVSYYKRLSGGSWSAWQSLGGTLSGQVAAAATGSGSVYMFGTNAAGKPYFRHWNGTTWDPWLSMGGTLTSPPTAVEAGGAIYVFGLGGGGKVYHKLLSGVSWSGWHDLGGSLTGQVASVATGGGHDQYAFGLNAAGRSWYRHLE